jgi:uncharacterized membrane protein YphA (DoxX/SURF4 family)
MTISSGRKHAGPGPTSDQPAVPEPTFAERARTLVYLGRMGSLSTLSRKQPGFPFGSVMPYGLDDHGRPVFLISTMAMHTQNLLGVFVFWASIPMAVVLLVAMISVHLPYGFSSVKLVGISASGARFGPVGYEIDLLYLAALLMLAVQGPGPIALDNVLQDRRIRSASSEKEDSPHL